MTEQQREIETIKERNIQIKLSDEDCKRIAEKAGCANMTVGELLGEFIGDLVCGTYSNGSDERDMAYRWFERCHFGMFPERTFLVYLLSEYEAENYEATKERIDDLQSDILFFITHIEEVKADQDWHSCFSIERVDGEEIHRPSYQNKEEEIAEYEKDIAIAREELADELKDLERIWNDFLKWTDIKEPNKEEEIANYEKWVEQKEVFVSSED